MYIAEIFIKWLNKNKRGNGANPNNNFKEGINIDSDENILPNDFDDASTCKHNFMPIDSTGTILACTKCGFVIKQRNTKKDK